MSTPELSAVSVIIPSYNGAHLLPTCLDALRRQTWRSFDVVVVDNASTDGSQALLAERSSEVRLLPLPTNTFFSGAVNHGIRATSTPLVALLNNDTEPEPTWLAELVAALGRHPTAGMATSKILLFDRRDHIHSAGDFLGVDGVPGNRGVWQQDNGRYDREEEVFGACGGAAIFRRSMLADIGLLDEDFVAYCEDVDLSFRAQLAGYRCVYVPTARVYHRLSATGGGPIASFHCGRNFLWVVAKNMPASFLRRHWHRIVRAQIALSVEALLHVREPAARARLRGQLAGLAGLPKMLAKRRPIQDGRRVDDEYLAAVLTR